MSYASSAVAFGSPSTRCAASGSSGTYSGYAGITSAMKVRLRPPDAMSTSSKSRPKNLRPTASQNGDAPFSSLTPSSSVNTSGVKRRRFAAMYIIRAREIRCAAASPRSDGST